MKNPDTSPNHQLYKKAMALVLAGAVAQAYIILLILVQNQQFILVVSLEL